jgi:hypothetical protein
MAATGKFKLFDSNGEGFIAMGNSAHFQNTYLEPELTTLEKANVLGPPKPGCEGKPLQLV